MARVQLPHACMEIVVDDDQACMIMPKGEVVDWLADNCVGGYYRGRQFSDIEFWTAWLDAQPSNATLYAFVHASVRKFEEGRVSLSAMHDIGMPPYAPTITFKNKRDAALFKLRWC